MEKTYIAVWNNDTGETRVFENINQYKDYAKMGGSGQGYSIWPDEIYEIKIGQNIFDGDLLDLWAFKDSIS